MGESELVKLLGVEEIPYYPTDLEKFAEEIALEKNIQLIEINNKLDKNGWAYWYEKKGECGKYSLCYTLECFIGNVDIGPTIPITEAKEKFKKLMAKKEFHEGLALFENAHMILHIHYAPNLNLEPEEYVASINSTKFSSVTIENIKLSYSLSQKNSL